MLINKNFIFRIKLFIIILLISVFLLFYERLKIQFIIKFDNQVQNIYKIVFNENNNSFERNSDTFYKKDNLTYINFIIPLTRIDNFKVVLPDNKFEVINVSILFKNLNIYRVNKDYYKIFDNFILIQNINFFKTVYYIYIFLLFFGVLIALYICLFYKKIYKIFIKVKIFLLKKNLKNNFNIMFLLIILLFILYYFINNQLIKQFIFYFIIIAGILLIIFSRKQKIYNFDIENKIYNNLLYLLFFIFVIVKFFFIFYYQGSYIDEYSHILSAVNLIKNGTLPAFYNNEQYFTRGIYISYLCFIFFKIFGESLFVAKLIPALFGIINFILLIIIINKIIKNNITKLIFFIIYIIHPYIIFNHFYLRTYIFMEFIFIFLLLIFIYLIESIRKNQIYYYYIYISIIIILNIIFNTFINDEITFLIRLQTFSFLFYIFLFEIKNFYYKFLNLSFVNKSIFLTINFLFLFIAIYRFIDNSSFIDFYLNGKILYGSTNNIKYNEFFYNINFIFFIFLFFSFIIKNKFKFFQVNLILFISLIILFLNIFSSKDIQIMRGILFYLPLFYLSSLIFIDWIIKYLNIKFIILLFILIIFGVIKNYLPDFFKGPYIKKEINYEEYKHAYNFINNYLNDYRKYSTLDIPYISEFYKVKIDFIIYKNINYLENDERFIFDNNKYFSVYGKIPVITEKNIINNIIISNEKNCILIPANFEFSLWKYLDNDDIDILEKNYEKKIFQSIIIFYKK